MAKRGRHILPATSMAVALCGLGSALLPPVFSPWPYQRRDDTDLLFEGRSTFRIRLSLVRLLWADFIMRNGLAGTNLLEKPIFSSCSDHK